MVIQKFEVVRFLKEVFYVHQGCIYLNIWIYRKYSKNSNIVKYYYNLK